MHNETVKYEPAASIIEALDGFDAVASGLRISLTQVYRWTYSRERKGCGGYIPRWHHDRLIEMAKSKGLKWDRSIFRLPDNEIMDVRQAS